jgi:hypothetical protein
MPGFLVKDVSDKAPALSFTHHALLMGISTLFYKTILFVPIYSQVKDIHFPDVRPACQHKLITAVAFSYSRKRDQ